MSTTFDEILLDINYSALADGGPEWATAIIDAGDGGNISFRNVNREDYISRYEIDFAEVDPQRRKFLRKFSILREGMARGFRFLPPDDFELNDDTPNIGYYNSVTGEIAVLLAADGILKDFYLIKYYSDSCNSYLRQLVKPSPYDDFVLKFFNSSNVLQRTVTFPADSGLTGELIDQLNSVTDGSFPTLGSVTFTLNQWTGKITISQAIPSGWRITAAGIYHLPVCFEDDWQKFSVDEGGISSYKVRLRELLPVELGITPSETSITVSLSDADYNGVNFDVTGTATGVASIRLYHNGIAVGSAVPHTSGTFTLSLPNTDLTEGWNSFQILASDGSNSATSNTISRLINIDSIDPGTITYGRFSGTASTSFLVEFDPASDEDGFGSPDGEIYLGI